MAAKRVKRRRRNKRYAQKRRLAMMIIALGTALVVLVIICVTAGITKYIKGKNEKEQNTAQVQSEQLQTESEQQMTEQETTQSLKDLHADETVESGEVKGVTSKGYAIQVIDGVTYIGGVMIVNKTYTLPASYAPGDLLPEVKEAFEVMQKAAAAEGLNIYISSGYRSYTRQQTLYNNYVKTDGKELADTYSSRPGHSEHQSGLCFDLNTIDDSFGATKESAWLEKHAQEYGFIIRFPKGKDKQTGYQYEPWHLRYLGVEMAEKVKSSGLSLEEYFGITSEYEE